jgi:Transposase domain (DUF772)
LQYRTGLSDEQAMEATAWDLRWKLALGLPVDHRGWNSSTLTRFRARLLLHGKERLALENSLALAEELGLLDGPAEQIVDSTPIGQGGGSALRLSLGVAVLRGRRDRGGQRCARPLRSRSRAPPSTGTPQAGHGRARRRSASSWSA